MMIIIASRIFRPRRLFFISFDELICDYKNQSTLD